MPELIYEGAAQVSFGGVWLEEQEQPMLTYWLLRNLPAQGNRSRWRGRVRVAVTVLEDTVREEAD